MDVRDPGVLSVHLGASMNRRPLHFLCSPIKGTGLTEEHFVDERSVGPATMDTVVVRLL